MSSTLKITLLVFVIFLAVSSCQAKSIVGQSTATTQPIAPPSPTQQQTATATFTTTPVATATATPYPSFSASVELDELVYEFEDPENGIYPVWSFGSSLIAGNTSQTFISGVSLVGEVAPPNNIQCVIYERTPGGWQRRIRMSETTREPCPIAIDEKHLWVSTNPARGELSEPQLLRFDLAALETPPETLKPEWIDDYHEFTAWSYRGLGVDSTNGEGLVMNISGYQSQYWAYLDKAGNWSATGQLFFPPIKFPDQTTPAADENNPLRKLRLSYPSLALRDRHAYVLAVSDIEAQDEIVRTYLENRNESTYLFQQLYFAWTDDITSQPFSEWTELVNLEPAGSAQNQDVWIAPDGTIHLLWTESTLDSRLEFFFPETQEQTSLWHATMREGSLISKEKLADSESTGLDTVLARFFENPEGRLFVFYSAYDAFGSGNNGLMELYSDGKHSRAFKLNMQNTLVWFLSAGQRDGVKPSPFLDLVGIADWGDPDVRYVRIKVE